VGNSGSKPVILIKKTASLVAFYRWLFLQRVPKPQSLQPERFFCGAPDKKGNFGVGDSIRGSVLSTG
jgi:hypothetical protein